MVCMPVVGSVCHPLAFFLHRRLDAVVHSARHFARSFVDIQFHSVSLRPLSQKIEMLLAACGAGLTNKSSRSARVNSLSSSPHRCAVVVLIGGNDIFWVKNTNHLVTDRLWASRLLRAYHEQDRPFRHGFGCRQRWMKGKHTCCVM